MLSPIERLKVGYKALLVKMVLDNHINQQAKQIYEHLCDLQILLGLAYILPLLESMHALIKFAHMRMSLCATLWLLSRFVKMIRITLYLEQSSNFFANTYWAFKSLLECRHEDIHMKWILDLNFGLQHLAFDING